MIQRPRAHTRVRAPTTMFKCVINVSKSICRDSPCGCPWALNKTLIFLSTIGRAYNVIIMQILRLPCVRSKNTLPYRAFHMSHKGLYNMGHTVKNGLNSGFFRKSHININMGFSMISPENPILSTLKVTVNPISAPENPILSAVGIFEKTA